MASAKRANSKKRSITGANSSAATSSRGEEGGGTGRDRKIGRQINDRIVAKRFDPLRHVLR